MVDRASCWSTADPTKQAVATRTDFILKTLTVITHIPASALRVGMYIHKLGGSWLQHPFLRTSFLLTDEKDIRAILDAGIEDLWIDESKGLPIDETVLETADEVASGDGSAQSSSAPVFSESPAAPTAPVRHTAQKSVSTQSSMSKELDRARDLCQQAGTHMADLFRDARLGRTIDAQTTLPLVGEITASVQRHPAALLSIARLKTHDDYTYLHSVAVCTMMVALGRQLGLDEKIVRLAGHGGLLHDIGKATMPLDVLNKPGRLTDQEFEVIKRHPLAGASMLSEDCVAPEVRDVALHHHEKVDGSGYPHRLAGENISLFARMGAICDVYDAVTSNRVYKRAWDPATAMREIAKWQGHFDKRLFQAFVKTVGIYPVGSLVRLASQRLAVVTEPNPGSLLKPKVRVFFSVRVNAPIDVQTIDLAANTCNDSILGPEDADKWSFTRLDDIWLATKD